MKDVTKLNITMKDVYGRHGKVSPLGVKIKANDGTLPKWKDGISDYENGKFIESLYGKEYIPKDAV